MCQLAVAQGESQENRVYTGQSKLTVDNINNAVEVLRDPTVMSANFRKALSNLPGNSEDAAQASTTKALGLPDIELVAKVLGGGELNSVVFKANDKYFHFEEGDQISKVINKQVVTLHVQEISKHTVRLLVMPFNKTLIFN